MKYQLSLVLTPRRVSQLHEGLSWEYFINEPRVTEPTPRSLHSSCWRSRSCRGQRRGMVGWVRMVGGTWEDSGSPLPPTVPVSPHRPAQWDVRTVDMMITLLGNNSYQILLLFSVKWWNNEIKDKIISFFGNKAMKVEAGITYWI